MSRTKKGSKVSGYEYWSARPLNRFGGIAGKFTKKLTHRIERRALRKEAVNRAEFVNDEIIDLTDLLDFEFSFRNG